MKENILILVNSFISCSKKQYFKTQLINTEHRTQNTDTEHRTQTQLISGLVYIRFISHCIWFFTKKRFKLNLERQNIRSSRSCYIFIHIKSLEKFSFTMQNSSFKIC